MVVARSSANATATPGKPLRSPLWPLYPGLEAQNPGEIAAAIASKQVIDPPLMLDLVDIDIRLDHHLHDQAPDEDN